MSSLAKSNGTVGLLGVTIGWLVVSAIASCPALTWAQTFTYEINLSIRYDVTENGTVIPGTVVWGTPPLGPILNGTIDLVIDGAGNVSGETPVHQATGLGMLNGERVYSPDRNTFFEIMDAT